MNIAETYIALKRLLTREERGKTSLMLLAFVVSGILEVAGVASIGPFMAVITDPENVGNSRFLGILYEFFAPTSHGELVGIVGLIVLALLTFNNGVGALVLWKTNKFLFGQQHRFSQRLLRQYLSQSYTFFLQRNTSDLIKNIFLTVNLVVGGMMMPAALGLSRVFVVVFILLFLLILDPVLALSVGAMVSIIYTLIYLQVKKRLHRDGRSMINADRGRNKIASEALNGVREVKVFNSEEWFLEQFGNPSQTYADCSARATIISSIPRYALEVIAFATMIFVVLYAFQVNEGDTSAMLNLVALYAFAALRLMPAVQVIFQGITRVQFNHEALNILVHEFESSMGQVLLPKSDDKPLLMKQQISIQNLVFSYSEEAPVLKGIDMEIPVTTIVGIVGSSGSGKTTFVDLLLGLLTPSSGKILVDGELLVPKDIPSWRKSIGYVSQNMYLLDGTLAENIAFGVPKDQINMEAVAQAATQAHIDDFIKAQPEGYHTVVGDRGARLSGGQRQRVAIARALYRDPQILILDEATNALDNVTEAKIIEVIHDLSRSKTVIMIAHRLSIIRECDQICVFHQGTVVASNTYDVLLEENSIFQALVEAGGKDGSIP